MSDSQDTPQPESPQPENPRPATAPSGGTGTQPLPGPPGSGAASSGPPGAPPPGSPPPQGPPPPPWGQVPAADRLAHRLRALRRSRNERLVAGVCGGVARGLGIDPLLL